MRALLSNATWFRRRPFFWWALAAIGAVFLTCGVQPAVRAPLWLAALGGAVALGIFRRWLSGSLLAVAALCGLWAAQALSPSLPLGLTAGAQATVRGELARSRAGAETPDVLRVRWRLSPRGWERAWGSLGLYPPEGAQAGDLVEASGVLRVPPPQVNPGGRSPRLDWLRRGVRLTLHLRKRGFQVIGRARPEPLWAWGRSLRVGLLENNRRTLSPTAALIANDFLVGDADNPDQALSAEVERLFRDSGTIHLLVVSGTQVTVVLGLFVWLGWRFYRLRYAWWGLGFLGLGVFYLITDGSASVVRAAVIGGVVTLGLMLEREPDLENCLGVAALALLGWNPLTVFDVGAQLSFLAVWSLVRLGKPLEQALGPAVESPRTRLHSKLAAIAAATVAAHLATAPLLAFHLQRSAWSGIPANLFVFVIGEVFTGVAVAHALLTAIGCPVLGWPVECFASALCGWARFFAQPPFGAGNVYPPPLWLVLLILAGLALPLLLPRGRAVPLVITAAMAGILLLSERLPAEPPPAPTLRALDIGQGDALLLQGTDGGNVLVDAGPAPLHPDSSPLVRALRALRVPALDAMVVSHMHADHIGGMTAVLEALPVRLLVEDARTGDWDEWTRVRAAAERLRIPVVQPHAGDRLQIRTSALTVLGPLREPNAAPPADPNDESLLLRWDSGGARMLLTGDTGQNTEGQLLRWGPDLKSDVLKVGHHGSRKASTEAWLRAIQPRVAVLSCGRDNRFGHPSRDTLARLQAAGARVERTDESGMVTIQVEKSGIRVERYWREQ